MELVPRLQRWLGRIATRRYRSVLVASVVTLLISATLTGLICLMQWRGRHALQSDTKILLAQAGQQLVRSLQSRRGTLTFLRDTVNRQSDLTPPQLQAMGASAVQHTRNLLGDGVIRATALPTWWSGPTGLSTRERVQLDVFIAQRIQRRVAWRVPSTFAVTTKGQRALLVMTEPLRSPAYPSSAVIGVFDLKPFFEDFAASALPQRVPVQCLDGGTILYRSADWNADGRARRPIIVERTVAIDAARWTIQMQPGQTRVVQTLSWLNILLIGLGAMAALGLTVIVWLLAARTWILQWAVKRRTAALRRTMERLRQLATTDELTGLSNRRFFLQRWEWECQRAKRYHRPLACLLIDVNEFKQVNDRLGHPVGDLVLKQVAEELKVSLRESDIVARFGGDEFIAALPETSPEQAELVAEKLRQLKIEVPSGGRRFPPVRLSVGLSHAGEEDDPEAIIRSADQSLYADKRSAAPALAAGPSP